MVLKIGFAALRGSDEETQPSLTAPDLSGPSWEYWYKTQLITGSPNLQGDGVLRLHKSIFVRVAWDTGSGADRCTVTREDQGSNTACLEFARPVTTPAELSEFISRWVEQIESQLSRRS
jgi:hypothetical protein